MIDFGQALNFQTILKLTFSLLPVLLIIFAIWLICYCIKNKVKIKWKTFTKKSFRPNRGDFGLFVYCGSQGSERERLTR